LPKNYLQSACHKRVTAVNRHKVIDPVIRALRVDCLALSASHHVHGLIPLNKKVMIPDKLMQMMLVRNSKNAKKL